MKTVSQNYLYYFLLGSSLSIAACEWDNRSYHKPDMFMIGGLLFLAACCVYGVRLNTKLSTKQK